MVCDIREQESRVRWPGIGKASEKGGVLFPSSSTVALSELYMKV